MFEPEIISCSKHKLRLIFWIKTDNEIRSSDIATEIHFLEYNLSVDKYTWPYNYMLDFRYIWNVNLFEKIRILFDEIKQNVRQKSHVKF